MASTNVSDQIIGRRTRINPCEDVNERCKDSSPPDPPKGSSISTPPSTTPSTINVISKIEAGSRTFAPKHSVYGKARPQLPEEMTGSNFYVQRHLM